MYRLSASALGVEGGFVLWYSIVNGNSMFELLPIVEVFLLKFNVAWFTSSVGHTLLNLGMDVTCVMLD